MTIRVCTLRRGDKVYRYVQLVESYRRERDGKPAVRVRLSVGAALGNARVGRVVEPSSASVDLVRTRQCSGRIGVGTRRSRPLPILKSTRTRSRSRRINCLRCAVFAHRVGGRRGIARPRDIPDTFEPAYTTSSPRLAAPSHDVGVLRRVSGRDILLLSPPGLHASTICFARACRWCRRSAGQCELVAKVSR